LRRLLLYALSCLALGLNGCGDSSPEPAKTPPPKPLQASPDPTSSNARHSAIAGLPEPPLKVPAPLASPNDGGRDLTTLAGSELILEARRLSESGDHRRAAQYRSMSVRASGEGQFELALDHSMAGDIDAAFHWLQEAALTEGVNPAWADRVPGLEAVRRDTRWPAIPPFLKECNTIWARSGHRRTVLVAPTGYSPGTPIGVVVGLHGIGGGPDGFLDDSYRGFADELNMAFVAVSGSIPFGQRSFAWSEDPEADARQVRRALVELGDRLTIDRAHVILYGFSEGGQMAFEIAFRHPNEFRGALAISPGATMPLFRFNRLKPSAGNKGQGFVFLCGAEEAFYHVEFTRADAEFAQQAGARVVAKFYNGIAQHDLPPDFARSFVRWLRFVDSAKQE
jgi:predicted esterase